MIITDRDKVTKNIGAFLQHVRRQGYGASQPDIAKETGISQHQLSLYENEKALPSLMAAIALADMFDVSLDYLVGRCQNSRAHKTTKTFTYKED